MPFRAIPPSVNTVLRLSPAVDTLRLLTNAFHLFSLIPNIHTHLCLCVHPISLTQLNDIGPTNQCVGRKQRLLSYVASERQV